MEYFNLVVILLFVLICNGAKGSLKDPLFLTPLLENNKISEAQNAAKVQFLGIKSYSGFLTVNKTYNSNLFFWFFPASETNFTEAPVILWLAGGPGMSSLFGLFEENGPISINNKLGVPQSRKYSWTKKHSVIYIDNPVGSGFSFTENDEGYAKTETDVGNNLYEALKQFFTLFPELQKNEFYVSGESYAGKYIPAVSYKIHQENPSATIKINLKGMLIGNGLCDPVNQLDYDKYLYQIGLIDLKTKAELRAIEDEITALVEQEKWKESSDKWDILSVGATTGGSTFFNNATGFTSFFNLLRSNETPINTPGMDNFLNNSLTRTAIHVGDVPFSTGINFVVAQYLSEYSLHSLAPLISELLDHYRIIFYNGQLDITIAYPYTVNFIQKLNFSGADDYKVADRHQWYVDGELAGYFKDAGNLTEVLVRNAGHLAIMDQPKWIYDLFSNFVSNQPLGTN